MKKKLFTVMVCAVCMNIQSYSQMEVHDSLNNIPLVSSWLTAVDTLYSNYDMVMNAVTQIQNQYKAIQQAIDNAKGIDWDNITFDGDFDIRDDIKDATKRVNSLLNQAYAINKTLNTPIINADGITYSIADLCGGGEPGKSFASCVSDVYGYMTDNMKTAADEAVSTLTDKQKKAIYAKYGISPRNYYLVAQSSKYVRDKALACVAATTEEARNMVREEHLTKLNVVVNAALEAKTADGTIPQGALDEANLIASQQIVDECLAMRESIENMAAATSQKILAEEQQKEIEAAEEYQTEQNDKMINNNLPAGFMAGKVK